MVEHWLSDPSSNRFEVTLKKRCSFQLQAQCFIGEEINGRFYYLFSEKGDFFLIVNIF